MRRTFLTLLILVPMVLPLRAGAQPSSDRDGTIVWQGVERYYVLHRREGLAGSEPLVVALHGRDQDLASLRQWLAMDATADKNGFAVVYPQALGLLWNYWTGSGATVPDHPEEEIDDVGFIAAVLAELVKNGVAAPDRVYLTGISRGALMSWSLVCARADLFRAVAPLSSAMTAWHQAHCSPSRLVPVIAVDGTTDPVQPYDGFLFAPSPRPIPRLLSVPETMAFWWQLHACTGERMTALPHATNASDPTRVMRYEWTGCAKGGGVTLYRVNNGGHMPPSRDTADDDTKRFGSRNHDVETAELIWRAFVSAP
jgi:polyhydroxybutyrate depolymerase